MEPDDFSMPSLGALQRLKGEQALDKQLAGISVSEGFRARLADDLSSQQSGMVQLLAVAHPHVEDDKSCC